MSATRMGFAMTGSFCTFSAVFLQLEALVHLGYDVTPILSYHAGTTDSRFYKASEIQNRLEQITGKKPLLTIAEVEPIGPKRLLDVYVLAPMTGASLGKMACGIFDTPALLGAKSHLRNGRPVVIAPSTNDGLGISGENIGKIMNMKNVYFVPFGQDDPSQKPRSLVADFEKMPMAVAAALAGEQLQPVLISHLR